jgi:1-acyl-sn-glycerol-3-phosphate acyltransferase
VAPRNPRPGSAFLFIEAIVRPILVLLTKRDWRGRKNVPKTGGALLVVNHYSYFDPMAVGHFVLGAGRTPRFTAKSGIFKNPRLGKLFVAAGQIPVYRGTRDAVKALLTAQEAIKRGEVVVFYPEGTMTKDPDLWPMAGRTGAARVALRAGVPVIPMAQWGAQEVLAPYSTKFHFLPRKTLKVVAGPPLDLSPWAGRTRDRAAEQEVTDLMMAEITKLLEGLRGETAPAVRFVQPPEELAPAAEPAKSEAAKPEPESANEATPADPAKPESEPEATPAAPAAQDSKAASGAEVGE